MSWCRWSSELPDGRLSDLYIFDHTFGHVQIYVAKRRRAGAEKAPKLPVLSECNTEEWIKAYITRMAWLNKHSVLEDIGLPHDGESFEISDPDEIIEVLKMLKEEGYLFPEHVFDIAEEYRIEYNSQTG